MGAMTTSEHDEWYGDGLESYDDDDEPVTVECENCGAEVAEDDSTDDGLCLDCARQ